MRVGTVKDIAAAHNISRQAVQSWRKRHRDFPAPMTGHIYNLNRVDSFARRHRLGIYQDTP